MPSQPNQQPQIYQTRSRTNEQRIALLEEKLGHAYQFRNRLLALEALQLDGQTQQIHGQTLAAVNNQGLAITGDHLLDLHLSFEWRPTGLPPATYTDARKNLTSNMALGRLGRDRGIGACVIRKPGAMGEIELKDMATTIEAIIAAVYLDAEKSEKGTGMDMMSQVATELGINFSNRFGRG